MNTRERDSVAIITLVFVVIGFILIIELYRKVLSITTFYSTEATPPSADFGSTFLTNLVKKRT